MLFLFASVCVATTWCHTDGVWYASWRTL